jgi:hypothetical protein
MGTVTGIIQEARKQEEYSNIDLLREVSKKLKEEGLDLPSLGFAIRLNRIREENDIEEDQIESIIQKLLHTVSDIKCPMIPLLKSDVRRFI